VALPSPAYVKSVATSLAIVYLLVHKNYEVRLYCRPKEMEAPHRTHLKMISVATVSQQLLGL